MTILDTFVTKDAYAQCLLPRVMILSYICNLLNMYVSELSMWSNISPYPSKSDSLLLLLIYLLGLVSNPLIGIFHVTL